jgi:uncharacterized protein YprB with RNaseH-like and TPR domain
MNLADRLRAVVNPATRPTAPRDPEGVARGVGTTGTPHDHSATPSCVAGSASGIEVALGGEWRGHQGTRTFVITRRMPADAPYGHSRVGDLADRLLRATAAAPLVSTPTARAPYLFFDLETTGLCGGAGTYAFLVGCGWFDDDAGFVTEQHLLVDHASERAMLQAVAQEFGRAGALVSFNGKSFDAPVLETRFLFNRMASPCASLPHVDVLHPARRFWGPADASRLHAVSVGGRGRSAADRQGPVRVGGSEERSCSLMTLERQVLGATRVCDVPGFEIPARYFQFVRSGDPRPLAAVAEHNRLDLLSLAGLTANLLHLIDAGPDAAQSATEALGLGRVYTRAGVDERAESAFTRAIVLSGSGPAVHRRVSNLVKIDALRSLAQAARRARRYEVAASHWRHLLEVPGCPRQIAREANEALAIHHEHRARDLSTAKLFALKSVETEPETAWGDAVRHRLARLERKMVIERRSLFPSLPSQPQPSCGSPRSAPRTSS